MEQAIRVLCVFSTLDRGGAETMCMNLYRHIDREKVQFDFVKHTPQVGAFEEEIRALGGRIFEAPRYKVYNHLSYCAWWKKHLREHPEHQIIHGHFFTISAVFLHMAKKMGRITVAHSHCTPTPEAQIRRKIKGVLEKYLVSQIERNAKHCFACSKPAGEWIFPQKEFIVLNNAIDTDKFVYSAETRDRVRKELRLEDNFVVGAIGRIMLQKNPLGIVDIFNAVYQQNPEARLLWIGDDGKGTMAVEARERAKEYGILDRIIFTGVRSDVNELVQAMDVFILPSFYEGLGIVAIEAQAAGLPCFLSDAVPEEANVTGRCTFLPLGDPKAWADAILSADLMRRDTTQQIKDAGYDIHTTAKWLQEFYLEIAEKDS